MRGGVRGSVRIGVRGEVGWGEGWGEGGGLSHPDLVLHICEGVAQMRSVSCQVSSATLNSGQRVIGNRFEVCFVSLY